MERKQMIIKAVFRWLLLAGALGWWGLWAMCFLDDDCCCYDLAMWSQIPMMLMAPLLLVRCVVWRRTLGWLVAITALISFVMQLNDLTNCVLLLTGDKAGCLNSHGVICKELVRWNISWLAGMFVSAILFWKSRQIGRSIKSPVRYFVRKIGKRRK